MTLIATGLSIEEFPAAVGGSINRVLVAGDEMVKRRIKRQLCAFVGRDGSQKVGTIGRAAKYTLECLPVFFDTRDLCDSRIQVWVTHLNSIDNRERRLFLERLYAAIPALRLVIQCIENRRRIALANPAFYTDGRGLSVGEGEVWTMAVAARHSTVS